MKSEEATTKKRVSVSQLKPGVYIAALDQSWFQSRFYFHRRMIKDDREIELLKKHGIREVVIDTARGADVETPPAELLPELRVTSGDDELPSPAILEPSAPASADPALRSWTKELDAAQSIQSEALLAAQNIFDGVGSGAPLNSPAARKVVTDLLASVTQSAEANLLLAQLRRFQNDLFTHAVNVCVLSLVFAAVEGIDGDAAVLGLGALLHDIGKTRLPRSLIRRKEPYTDSQRRLLEQHAKLGTIIISEGENIPELTKRIVGEHHERLDGSGYPAGLRGDQISALSQIVGITDAYDSLLTGRKQPALQPIEVLRRLYLEGNAGAFDSDLVERIIHCLGVYPAGSLVELNTGERGVVLAANRADSLKPMLHIISSCDGVQLENGPIISLADGASDSVERRIVRALDPGKERVNLLGYLKFAPAALG